MRRKTIKAKISAALSASMALAMLAPAMPAYAAISYNYVNHNLNTAATKATYKGIAANIGDVTPRDGYLGFDFTTLNPSIAGWVNNIAVNGNPGESITDQTLPFFPGGTFSDAATFDGKSWINDFDLEGYKIAGYNQAPLKGTPTGFPRSSQIEIPSLTSQGAVYYAELASDGSKFDYVVGYKGADDGHGNDYYLPGSKYDLTVSTMNAAHTSVINPATEHIDTTTGGKEVLTGFQANAKPIIGYKVAGNEVKLYKSGTNTLWTGNPGFSVTDGRISGETINKDTFITFKYKPDTDKKFKLTVVDNYYNYEEHPAVGVTIGEGVTVHAGELKRSGSPRSITRPGSKSYYATQVVNNDSATKAKNGTYKLDGAGNIDLNPGSDVEYILDPANPVDIEYTYTKSTDLAGAANYGKFLDASGNVMDIMIPFAFDTNPSNFTPINVAGLADGYKPQGQMLNQNVTIKYNYIKNPNYYRGITISYVDEEGNDINDKVVDALGSVATLPASPALPTIGTVYKNASTGNLFIRVNSTTAANYDIPLPKLDTYISYDTSPAGIPGVEPESTTAWDTTFTPVLGDIATALNPGGAQAWTAANRVLRVNSAAGVGKNISVTITYNRDLGSIATINPLSGIGGKLIVPAYTNNIGLTVPEHEYAGGTYPNDATFVAAGLAGQPIEDTHSLPRVKNITAGTYHVNITDSDLPTPVPDQGYRFRGWKMTDGNWLSVNSFADDDPAITPRSLPANSLEQNQGIGTVTVNAVFELDPTRWKKFKLVSGDNHITFGNGNNAKVLTYDYTHNTARTNIPSSDLNEWIDESTGKLTVESGYVLKWYDENFAEVDFTTINLADYPDGYTFTAYGRNPLATALYVPEVTPSLDSTTGAPVIAVDAISPTAMSVGYNYVVADKDGNVVAVLTGAQLLSNTNRGKISGSMIHPGESYKVYTADPTTSVTVGNQIPMTGISAPSTVVTIPTVLNATASEDPNNAGMAQIVIDPADANTQYALLDPSRNIVYDFTSPNAQRKVTFGNLNPDTVYTIVPRPLGSNDTPAARIADGVITENVNTGNLGITATVFPVNVIVNDADLPGTTTQISIGGANKTFADLQSVRFGQAVSIEAEPIDHNGALFKEWRVISGNTGHNNNVENNQTISFGMPRGPVKLQVLYDTGINFAPDYYPNRNTFDPNTIGVTYPVGSTGITTPGLYRIHIDQRKVTGAHERLVQDENTDLYKGEFEFKVFVESSNDGGNTWNTYTGADAPISLETSIHTGALSSTRNYSLYKLATDSNAVTSVPGVYETPAGGSGYMGEFSDNFETGHTYIFGYTSTGTTVKFVSIPDMSTLKTIVVAPGSRLSDYESDYVSDLPSRGDTFEDGNTGLTWTYDGLSSRMDKKESINKNMLINEDKTIYLYYTNDAEYRAKLVDGLNDSLGKVDNINASKYKASDVAEAQAKAAEARAILNRAAPNKAFSPELLKVLNELNAILNRMGIGTRPTPNNNGGGRGGRGGSGGGSGSSGRKAAAGQTAGLRVGYDGNWELLNPAEATANPDSSKWVFNLTAGGRVKGWAYLSYTYEGQTKSEWYHFGDDNIMNSGWFLDGNTWYYLSMNHNGFFGEMVKGWHHDGQDGRWYYLDANNGAMHTNWSKIGGEYYFLNPTAPAQTWFYDNATGRWNFGDVNSRPLGSMYQNENTPDGYHVNESGAWR